MKAAVYRKYGSPDVLRIEEVEKPNPGDNEVLVRIHASTVNRTDCANLRAKPFVMRFVIGWFKPRKMIPGTEFSGRIEAIGKEVTAFKVGDKVFGFCDVVLSSQAQYLSLSVTQALATMPERASYAQAAASSEGAHYAYNMIDKVQLQAGQSVLVNGAAGGIGSAAVQLLKFYGADVTGVCSAKDVELVRSLGADRVIDYTREDFTTDAQKYDYVFDTSGKSTFGKCKPVLKPDGIYISSELGPMAQNIFFALVTPLFGGRKVIIPLPLDMKRSVLLVKALIEQGKFKSVIDRTYPLEQIADAYRYVEKGHKAGNVVINIVSEEGV